MYGNQFFIGLAKEVFPEMKVWKMVMIVMSTAVLSACGVPAAAAVSGTGETAREEASATYRELLDVLDESTLPASETAYPEYYGGAFVDEDGELNVYVTRGYETDADELKKRFGEKAVYREGDYSYNTLTALMSDLNQFLLNEQEDPLAHKIKDASLDEENNRIVVEMEDISSQTIQVFREKISNSRAITFEKAIPAPMAEVKQAGSLDSTGIS